MWRDNSVIKPKFNRVLIVTDGNLYTVGKYRKNAYGVGQYDFIKLYGFSDEKQIVAWQYLNEYKGDKK